MNSRCLMCLVACALASCGAPAVVTIRPDGTHTIVLGASVLEKSASEVAIVTLPNGTRVEYGKTGKDQGEVVQTGIRTAGTYATLTGLADAQNTGEAINQKGATDRAGQAARTDRARIAADVKKSTFVPPP